MVKKQQRTQTGDKLAEWLFNAGVAAGDFVQSFQDGMVILAAVGGCLQGDLVDF